MIPKIIHYCWFGAKPMPKADLQYISGWKKLMPDYTFKCWTEQDIDITSIPFTKEAYDAGKFAFVADYTRIYALYHFGGIYMDTDVKALQSFDKFLSHRVFSSYEFSPQRDTIHLVSKLLTKDGSRIDKSILKVPGNGMFSALIGAEKGHPFIKDCLDFYNSHHFNYVFTNRLTIPTILALEVEKYGFKYIDKEQHLSEGIQIYDSSVFANYHKATSSSVVIHYCNGSWLEQSLFKKIKFRLSKIGWLRKIVLFVFPKKA